MRSSTLVLASAALASITLGASAAVLYAYVPFDARTFDLSSLQSPYFNPYGYVVSCIGVSCSALLLVVYAWRCLQRYRVAHRRSAWVGASALTGAMLLFVANSAHAVVGYDNWKLHGVLAIVGFALLILAHYTLARLAGLPRIYTVLAVTSWFIALVLFMLPRFTDLDLAYVLLGLEPGLMLGISEVTYLAIVYASLYRIAESHKEVICRP